MRSFTAAALAAVFLLAGCQQNAETPAQPPKDTTAPAEVANFTAVAGSASVVNLSWKNPADDDLYQVEITANPAHGSLKHAIYLAAEKGKDVSYSADALSADTEYTFTVKTVDKSLNKSAGAVKTARTQTAFVPGAPMTITLTQSPATPTNGSVTVTVTSSTSIQSAKWISGVKAVDEVLANGTAISGGSFTVSDNGTYTVAVVDNDGRREIKTITIGNIDKTPPAEVANFTATPGSASIINLSWKNPADDDLYQVEITAHPAHGSLKYAIYLAAEKGKDVSYSADALSADTEYTFTLKTIDKLLNKSAGVSKTARTQTSPVPGAPMTITLTQSPSAPTNGSVTVTVTSSTSIQSAKWLSGVKTVDEVLTGGTDISGGSFTVSDNGIYTVAVVDNDGRREIKTITVSNIDKTPPAKVKNLSAAYASGSGKITVTWTNPDDEDFAGCVLRWKKDAGSETEVEIPKTVTQHEISSVPSDGSVYEISVAAKDAVGNESGKESVTVTASLQAEVTVISLDRTHLDTVMTNRSITVTVTGSNFNTLSSLLVQVTDGHTSESPVTATIDAAHNTATATVSAPVPASPTEAGTVYTVKAIVNSATPAQATANFIVSKPAAVKEIVLSPEKIKFGSASNVSVKVKGANFDIRGETKIKLLDSEGQEVSASTVTVAPSVGNASEFTDSVPLPAESGVFTVALYFDGKKEAKTATLHLYDDPVITSIAIPRAGISYGGNKLPVMITGKNFTAPGISAASFSGTGAPFSNFKIISDTKATAEVSCPYTAGEQTVTVSCKTASQNGTLSVKNYSLWTPGKIVLADNTLADKDGFTLDTANPPIAVICGKNVYGAAIGVALHKRPSGLSWAKDGTKGSYTRFTGIICEPSVSGSGAALTAAFTGDEDGSDNWDYICSLDPEGTANAAENYPAFDWVLKYNTAYAAQLGSARPSWYMPSLAELCQVYKNKEAVNESLLKIKGSASSYADASLGTGRYWSSSQYSNFEYNAWLADFGFGNLSGDLKKFYYNVCCIAGF